MRFKVPIVVKPSTAHYPKQHMFVKKGRRKKPEGEGAPAPKKTTLSPFDYGNTTELGAVELFVTSLDSSVSVKPACFKPGLPDSNSHVTKIRIELSWRGVGR